MLAPEVRRAPRSSALVIVIVLTLLLAGAALRSVRLDDPPLVFAPTRQYNDALLARKYEQILGGDTAGLPRAVVRAAAPAEIEPPILESITAVTWRVVGDEPLWFPQAVSILFWAIGGWVLFLLLRRLASAAAGIAAVFVWSFLPFSVAAFRAFQPDPLMVASIVGAVLALVIHDDAPTRKRLLVAALAGGFAVFVKSPAIFFLAPVFAVLAYRRGGLRALWTRSTAVYAAVVIGPALLWNVFGFWIAGFLQNQGGNRIEPHLLVTENYWRGWAHLVLVSFGVVVPVAAFVGGVLARGRARWVGGALFVGYVGFGLVFTYHYMTHDYYHLPLVFVMAVGVGLLADRIAAYVETRRHDTRSIAVAVAVALVVVIGFKVSVESVRFPVIPAAIPTATRVSELEVPPKIGALLHHPTKTVFLAPFYGESLMFNGGLAGREWPATRDVKSTLAKLREETGAEYFVVTDMRAWQNMPALRAYLNQHYPLVAAHADYRVYDLRHATA